MAPMKARFLDLDDTLIDTRTGIYSKNFSPPMTKFGENLGKE